MLKRFKDVDLNQWNKDNLTPLLLAVKLKWVDLIDMFLKYGADPDSATPKG